MAENEPPHEGQPDNELGLARARAQADVRRAEVRFQATREHYERVIGAIRESFETPPVAWIERAMALPDEILQESAGTPELHAALSQELVVEDLRIELLAAHRQGVKDRALLENLERTIDALRRQHEEKLELFTSVWDERARFQTLCRASARLMQLTKAIQLEQELFFRDISAPTADDIEIISTVVINAEAYLPNEGETSH